MPNRTGHRDIFHAISDEHRRRIITLLSAAPRAAGDIVRHLPIRQSTVSEHLAVLRAAGLVTVEQAGRRRIYHLDPDALAPLRSWLDDLPRPTATLTEPSPRDDWAAWS